jgi:hypothetical protein
MKNGNRVDTLFGMRYKCLSPLGCETFCTCGELTILINTIYLSELL